MNIFIRVLTQTQFYEFIVVERSYNFRIFGIIVVSVPEGHVHAFQDNITAENVSVCMVRIRNDDLDKHNW